MARAIDGRNATVDAPRIVAVDAQRVSSPRRSMVPSLDEIVPSPVVDNDNNEEREVVEEGATRNATRWYASELLERKAMIRSKKIGMMETRSLLRTRSG